MACPQVITGDRFLERLLSHIDCQAQLIGSYGYQSLGEPGSLASIVVSGLLTLFIAIFGIRLLCAPAPTARDTVLDVVKIGIVLTLAFSWPAFRTLIYDLVLLGPGEIAAAISTPNLAQTGDGLARALQATDNAIASLVEGGTGRNSGAFIDGEAAGGTFASATLDDENTFGLARLAYLSSIIGGLALLRVAAGLLLALAPLAAALLLFEQTRGLFSGWLRGLVFAMVGSVALSIVLAIQLAILNPWLADALRVRVQGYAIPAAPTELLAMTLGFAIAQLALLALLSRVVFTRGWASLPAFPSNFAAPLDRPASVPVLAAESEHATISRAERISNSVATQIRREGESGGSRLGGCQRMGSETRTTRNDRASASFSSLQRLGSSYRRTTRRTSTAASRRDSLS